MSGKTGCCCRHHGPVIVFLFKTVAGAVSAAARERGSMSPRGVRLPILETRERQPRGPLKRAALLLPHVASCCNLLPVAMASTGPTVCLAAVAICCHLLPLVAYAADSVPRCCCHALPLVRVAYTNLKDPRNKAAQRPQKMPWPRGPLKLELRGRAAVPLLAGCHGVYGADGVPLSTARCVELRQRSEAAA